MAEDSGVVESIRHDIDGIDSGSVNNERYDETKARTIGDAVERAVYGEPVAAESAAEQALPQGEDAEDLRTLISKRAEANSRLTRYADELEYNRRPDHESPSPKEFDEFNLRSTESEKAQLFEKIQSPFEELYELNPGHFSSMPTKEFMGFAEQFKDLRSEVEAAQKSLTWAEGLVDAAKNIIPRLKGEELVIKNTGLPHYEASHIDMVVSLQRMMAGALILPETEQSDEQRLTTFKGYLDRDLDYAFYGNQRNSFLLAVAGKDGGLWDADALFDRLDSTSDGAFTQRASELVRHLTDENIDRTPRQNAEELVLFFESMAQTLGALVSQNQSAVEDFKAKYAPGPQHAGPETDE